jgi:hypothetical protein
MSKIENTIKDFTITIPDEILDYHADNFILSDAKEFITFSEYLDSTLVYPMNIGHHVTYLCRNITDKYYEREVIRVISQKEE